MKGRLPLLLLFYLALGGITAQQPQVAPSPMLGSAFAKYKNKLYIYGGYTNIDYTVDTIPSGQFFALDLSKPWTSKSPSWIQLPTGPRCPDGRGAVSLDGMKFACFPMHKIKPSIFSFETKIWSPSKAVISNLFSPLATLGDGTVLIPNGSIQGSRNSTIRVYDIYSFDSDSASSTLFPPPSAAFDNIQFMERGIGQGAVWSQYLKSAVYYGGNPLLFAISDISRSNLAFTYHPESKIWEEKV
ncbi:hypothetical protein DFQ26_002253 [Actinomortierella ambigua]|nr:hypothetical protein DFQ26_002253 [Actinomortierella ambigua]